MRFLVVADLHININKLNIGINLMDSIERTAIREAVQNIVVVGDLWDEQHTPPARVLIMIKNKLLRWCSLGFTVFWVRGNHEVNTKSKPEDSYIGLYDNIDHRLRIINSPEYQAFPPDIAVWFLPWYPVDEFKYYAEQFKIQSTQCPWARVKLLFSHIGLAEGNVSPTNVYTLNSKISVSDIYPEYYDWVLLGDIHITQYLRKNTLYCGCPIQLSFGDRPNQGAFVLDCSLGKGVLTNVHLDRDELFPRYVQYEITEELQLHTLTESPDNYVRLKVDVNLLGLANTLFKQYINTRRWNIEPLPIQKEKQNKGRMENVQENDTEKILDTWLDGKGLNLHQEFKWVAMKYLIGTGRMDYKL
jgi:DNA repair exonuclease SbcCD nuclease subunit